jgi:hypothetical protein
MTCVVHSISGEHGMFTFFVRGLTFFGEHALNAGKDRSSDNWAEYRKRKQLEQEIQTSKERIFLQQLVW